MDAFQMRKLLKTHKCHGNEQGLEQDLHLFSVVLIHLGGWPEGHRRGEELHHVSF